MDCLSLVRMVRVSPSEILTTLPMRVSAWDGRARSRLTQQKMMFIVCKVGDLSKAYWTVDVHVRGALIVLESG